MQEAFSSASIAPKEVLQLENSLKRRYYLMREWQTSSTNGIISVHTARNPLLNQKAVLNVHEQPLSRNDCIFATVCGLLLLKNRHQRPRTLKILSSVTQHAAPSQMKRRKKRKDKQTIRRPRSLSQISTSFWACQLTSLTNRRATIFFYLFYRTLK